MTEKIYARGRAVLTLKNENGDILNELDSFNTWTKCSAGFTYAKDNYGYGRTRIALLKKQTGLVRPFVDIATPTPPPAPASDYWTFFRNAAQLGPSVDLQQMNQYPNQYNAGSYWYFYGTTSASSYFTGSYYGIYLSIGAKLTDGSGSSYPKTISGEYGIGYTTNDTGPMYCPTINSIIRFSAPFSMVSTDTLTWAYYIYFSSNKYDNMKY